MFEGLDPGVTRCAVEFRHPFYDRLVPVYLGDYVTLDTGTGIVHTAPAYGVEDFETCRRYGMKDEDILTPVMGDGGYVPSLPLFGGLSIWAAVATAAPISVDTPADLDEARAHARAIR